VAGSPPTKKKKKEKNHQPLAQHGISPGDRLKKQEKQCVCVLRVCCMCACVMCACMCVCVPKCSLIKIVSSV
jgi:hypothetical protein